MCTCAFSRLQVAGASIQISGDMLPNSTERLVTVSGSVDAVTRGILQICNVMLEASRIDLIR